MARNIYDNPQHLPGSGRRKIKKKTNILLIALIIAFVMFMATMTTLAVQPLTCKTIFPKVTVNNISVGGLTTEEAIKKIENKFSNCFDEKKINVLCNGDNLEINVYDYFSIDYDKTGKTAYNTGRNKNLFKRIVSFYQKKDIPLVLISETDQLNNDLSGFISKNEEENSFYTINEEDSTIEISIENIKSVADTSKTAEKVLKNVAVLDFNDISIDYIEKPGKNDGELLYSKININPTDATVDEENNVIPHKPGIIIDKEEFIRHIQNDEKKFSMNAEIIQPEITTEKLKANMFNDLLGSATTYFQLTIPNRTTNITLAAKSINDVVIAPGKTFSFNNTLGPRTASNGYKEANVYANGSLATGYGGGICQVSSTLYSAQLKADLETVSRTPHMFTVTYVPLGQDATVDYGTIDYVFKNSTKYPIKIKSSVSGGTVVVSIYGTKENKNRTLSLYHTTLSTTPIPEVQEKTADLPAGETKVKQAGSTGAVVESFKIYYENGKEVERKSIGKSTYRPMNKIVLVGEGEPENNEVIKENTETNVSEELVPNADSPNTDTTDPAQQQSPDTTAPDTDVTEAETQVEEYPTV